MRPSIAVLLFAVGISACAHMQRPPREPPRTPQADLANANSARAEQPKGQIETRAHVKDGVRYEGFVYSGKHWLTGTATGLSDSTLTLEMRQGGGTVELSFKNVVRLETRESPTSRWRTVPWSGNKQTLYVALGISPPQEEEETTNRASKVAGDKRTRIDLAMTRQDMMGADTVARCIDTTGTSLLYADQAHESGLPAERLEPM